MKYLTLLLSLLLVRNVNAEVIYKTIPGTPFKDITEPVLVIDKRNVCLALPGSN